jgi:hypothetical protein
MRTLLRPPALGAPEPNCSDTLYMYADVSDFLTKNYNIMLGLPEN